MTEPTTKPISALLIVAHGDGGDARLNTNVRSLRDRLAGSLDLPVAHALLKEPETFAAARAALGTAGEGRVVVFPLFMSDGYFVRVKMPKALAEAGFTRVETMTPFGMMDDLVDLVAERLWQARIAISDDPHIPLRTLLVAHGSRSGEPASRLRAEAVAEMLVARSLGEIDLAFIEEPPSVADQLGRVDPAIVIGLFASEGTHALNDVKELVDEQPNVRCHVTAIGIEEAVAPMIARAVIARIAGARMPAVSQKG